MKKGEIRGGCSQKTRINPNAMIPSRHLAPWLAESAQDLHAEAGRRAGRIPGAQSGHANPISLLFLFFILTVQMAYPVSIDSPSDRTCEEA
jgi:hypothetical protein